MENEKDTVKIELKNFKGEILASADIDKEEIKKDSNCNPLLVHSLPKEFEFRNASGKIIFRVTMEDLVKEIEDEQSTTND